MRPEIVCVNAKWKVMFLQSFMHCINKMYLAPIARAYVSRETRFNAKRNTLLFGVFIQRFNKIALNLDSMQTFCLFIYMHIAPRR